jgi:hypothetical protein
MKLSNGHLSFGEGWERANTTTPTRRLFMPPGNGSLYPPRSLPQRTGDTQLMASICPTADDVWYWAMAWMNDTESFCLGMPAHRPVWAQKKTPALADSAPGPADFSATVDFFDIRSAIVQLLEKPTG